MLWKQYYKMDWIK